MEDTENYDRMCKKISQLTRVIFILNTKNDENESIMEALASAYEVELDSISKESNQIIGSLKNSLNKLKDNNSMEEKVKDINRKFEDSVVYYNKEIEKYKGEVAKKEKAKQDEYEAKMDKMAKDLVEIKKMYEAKFQELTKGIGEEKRKSVAEKESLKLSLTAEMENLKKLHTDKISQLADDQKQKENKMKADFLKEKEKIRDEYEKKLQEKEKFMESNSSASNKIIDEIKKGFEKQIKDLKSEMEKMIKTNGQQSNEIISLKKSIKDSEELLGGKTIEVNSLTAKVKELQEKINELEMKASNEKSALGDDLKNLNDKVIEEINKICLTTGKMQSCLQGMVFTEMSNRELISKKAELILNNKIKTEEISAVEKEITDLKEQIKGLGGQVVNSGKVIQPANKSDYSNELKIKLLSIQEDYRNIQKIRDEECKAVIHKLESEILQLEKSGLKKDQGCNNDFSQVQEKVKCLHENMNSFSLAISDQTKECEEVFDKLRGEYIHKEGQLLQLKSERDELMKNYIQESKKNSGEVDTIKKQFEGKIKELNAKIEDLNKDSKQQEESMNKRHQEAESKLKAEYEKKLKDLQNTLQVETDKLKQLNLSSSDEAKKKYEARIAELTKLIEELKAKLEKSQKDFEGDMKSRETSLLNELDELKKKQRDSSEALLESHAKELKALKNKSEQEYDELLKSSSDRYSKDMKEIEEKHKEQLEKLKITQRDEVLSLKDDHSKKTQNLTDSYEDKLRLKDDNCARQLSEKDKLVGSVNNKNLKLEHTIKELNEVIEKLKKDIDDREKNISDIEATIESFRREAEKTKEEYNKLTDALEKKYKDKNEAMEKSYSLKTENFKKIQLDELNKLRNDFADGMKVMEQRYNNLYIKHQDLLVLFEGRPSKDEDVDEINRLREELADRERTLRSAEANIDYYKNLLINNEENYNKYFGQNPKVADNPLKKRDSSNNNQPIGNTVSEKFKKKTSTNMNYVNPLQQSQTNMPMLGTKNNFNIMNK